MKRKFVKVMFFGALAFAVSTAVTSCKDYDGDVKNLQEQIEKITASTPVSTADMKAAVDAAKKELQGKVDGLEKLLNDKASQTKLETEIKRLEELLKTSVGEAASKFAAELATAKNDLKVLIDAKADKTYVDGLKTRIEQLEAMKNTLAQLIAAEEEYKATGDASGYKNTGISKYVNQTILAALAADGEIAVYVDNAVKAGMTAELKAIDKIVSDKTGGAIVSLEDFVSKVYEKIYNEEQGILARLAALQKYSDAIDAFVKQNGENYASYADVLAQIEKNRLALTSIVGADGKQFNANVATIVNDVLKAADGELAKLETKLQKQIDALKGRIQSVNYVPMQSNRQVNFTALYAKKEAADPNYGKILLAGASEQDVKFRISPASSVKSFVTNYDVTFSADQVIARSATDQFVAVGEPIVDETNGFVTYRIKSNAANSFVVCMHVTAKADKVETIGNANITSDYFAAMVGKKYLVGASRKVAAAVDKTIVYDKSDANADYNTVGEYYVTLSSSEEGSDPVESKLSTTGFTLQSLNTVFSLDNTTDFKLNGAVVTLKEYGKPSYIDKTTKISAVVTATGFYIPENLNELGTVKVVRETKEATVDYGTIKQTWKNTAQTVAAVNFPLNKIYDDNSVKITPAEFAAMTGTVVKGVNDKAYFEVATSGNVLTATITAQTPAGTYPIQVLFEAVGRKITVNATIEVQIPTIAALTVDSHLWGGTPEAGTVGFTPTLNNQSKPSAIALTYDLSKLFTNYAEVQQAVAKIDGASLVISVPNVANIVGVTYAGTILTFNKDTYTGKTTDGKVAKVQVVAKVALAGIDKPLQLLTADVTINDISGSWVAGTKAVTLNSKASEYALAKGFMWSDMRGKAMWKDGAVIKGGDFADNVEALSIYGLATPSFKFIDAEGRVITSPYLTIEATTGKLEFSETGKNFNFVTDYTVRVLVDAKSQWGTVGGYANNNIITVTIPAGVK